MIDDNEVSVVKVKPNNSRVTSKKAWIKAGKITLIALGCAAAIAFFTLIIHAEGVQSKERSALFESRVEQSKQNYGIVVENIEWGKLYINTAERYLWCELPSQEALDAEMPIHCDDGINIPPLKR